MYLFASYAQMLMSSKRLGPLLDMAAARLLLQLLRLLQRPLLGWKTQ